jgi:membrane protein DedA with SNARE-associated domain
LVLLIVLVGLETAKSIELVPPPAELMDAVGKILEDRGWWFLLLVSFAEHLVGMNVYFPGSIVIFISVSSLAGNPWTAGFSVLATITGAVFAHLVNYLIGRRLRGRNLAQRATPAGRASWKTLGVVAMFWHPHLGALVALAAGREGVRSRTVAATVIAATIFWQSLWGFFAYNVGQGVGRRDFGFWPMVGCVLVWAAVDLYWSRAKAKRQEPF